MNKITLFIVLFILLGTTVFATTSSKLVIDNPRPYQDINVSFTFCAFYNDATGAAIQQNNTYVYLTFQNTTYNMTNLTTKWCSTISSGSSEEVEFLINATSANYDNKTTSFKTRFRTPYYVTFKLYQKSLNNSDPKPYLNDFQYVVLMDKSNAISINSGLYDFLSNANSIVSGWNQNAGMPSTSLSQFPSNRVYVWGRYSNGEATIKVYEPSNYSVYVMSNKVVYSNSAFWEFQRPTDNNPSYTGTVLTDIALYNRTDVSDTPRAFNNTVVSISLSKYEVNAYYAILNWFYIFGAIVIYIIVLFVCIYAFGDSPGGWRFILAVGLGGAAIVVGLIWGLV